MESRSEELERLEHERKVAALKLWIADTRRQTAENEARTVFAQAANADFLAWLEEVKARGEWRAVIK